MKNQNYVAGFLFNPEKTKVALILKTKPEWQKGKLNAIGGKIEEYDESPLAAMIREFREETDFSFEDWREFCVLNFRGGEVHFFMGIVENLYLLRTVEEEEIVIKDIISGSLSGNEPALSNLSWLIPLALDKDEVSATVIDKS